MHAQSHYFICTDGRLCSAQASWVQYLEEPAAEEDVITIDTCTDEGG